MHNNNVWIILPAYNERSRIEIVLKELLHLSQNVVVIDDGSTDNTSEVARKITPHVLTHQINLGKGAALKTGCEYAFSHLKAQAVVFFDADGQHDPGEIKHFLNALSEGHQIVFGYRKAKYEMPIYKRLGNVIASQLLKLLFGQYIPDIPSGYKALTKSGYRKVLWDAQRYEVEMEIAARVAAQKLDFVTIPIKTIYHAKEHPMNAIDALTTVLHLIQLRVRL